MLLSHPAVAEVFIQNNSGIMIGFVVFSSKNAPLLSRACELEDTLHNKFIYLSLEVFSLCLE
jgi:hypothetical protein